MSKSTSTATAQPRGGATVHCPPPRKGPIPVMGRGRGGQSVGRGGRGALTSHSRHVSGDQGATSGLMEVSQCLQLLLAVGGGHLGASAGGRGRGVGGAGLSRDSGLPILLPSEVAAVQQFIELEKRVIALRQTKMPSAPSPTTDTATAPLPQTLKRVPCEATIRVQDSGTPPVLSFPPGVFSSVKVDVVRTGAATTETTTRSQHIAHVRCPQRHPDGSRYEVAVPELLRLQPNDPPTDAPTDRVIVSATPADTPPRFVATDPLLTTIVQNAEATKDFTSDVGWRRCDMLDALGTQFVAVPNLSAGPDRSLPRLKAKEARMEAKLSALTGVNLRQGGTLTGCTLAECVQKHSCPRSIVLLNGERAQRIMSGPPSSVALPFNTVHASDWHEAATWASVVPEVDYAVVALAQRLVDCCRRRSVLMRFLADRHALLSSLTQKGAALSDAFIEVPTTEQVDGGGDATEALPTPPDVPSLLEQVAKRLRAEGRVERTIPIT